MSKSLDEYLQTYIPQDELRYVKQILYGRSDDHELGLPSGALKIAAENNFEIKAYAFPAKLEELRKPRIVRIGAIQHSIVLSTTESIENQRKAIHEKVACLIKAASEAGVNVIATSEAWSKDIATQLPNYPMPFALATHEKVPWCDFAEDPETGPTTSMLAALAKAYNMVVVSSILVRDSSRKDTIWNAALVISNKGKYLGQHRKNHVPSMEDYNETVYYDEGNSGHPVFETEFGNIAINICYGRHHPQNWLMFGLNGAEIVFNSVATEGEESRVVWDIEARNAAIANSYFVVPVNRVGMEQFVVGEGKKTVRSFGPYYGSSYVASPDGCRTPADEGLLGVPYDAKIATVCRIINKGF